MNGLVIKKAAKKETFIYNWQTRKGLKNSLTLRDEEVDSLIGRGDPFVIRYLCPKGKTVLTDDIIRGVGNFIKDHWKTKIIWIQFLKIANQKL